MTTPNAKVLVVHVGHVIAANAANVASAKTPDVIAANSSDVTTAKSTHVGSAKASHVASAEPTTHVAPAKAAHTTTMPSTSSTAAARLSARGKKAPGKHRACQNHHHSSSHDILHLVGRTCRHSTFVRRCPTAGGFQRRDEGEMGMPISRLY
jgi:hypothetical protein